MLILGIESSCDDTSVALLECSEKGCFVIAEKIASQIEIHKKYGGVVPEIAGRMHAEKIVPLIEEVLQHSNTTTQQHNNTVRPDAIAVTAGPGLITGLVVGVEAARTLSYAWDIPLIAVNHVEGHIHSVEMRLRTTDYGLRNSNEDGGAVDCSPSTVVFPALALVASGGHTELILIKKQGEYKILGRTRDDAAGECFDKVAKLLGLPYPGGPEISRLAETGDATAIKFPRPMINEKMNFSAKGGPAFGWSFAGLKTSALYWLRDHTPLAPLSRGESQIPPKKEGGLSQGREVSVNLNDFCASFEQAIVDVLVSKTLRAAEEYKPKTIMLAGGVSANKKLRETFTRVFVDQYPISNIQYPQLPYAMDNAAMIAVAGYHKAKNKKFVRWDKIKVDPNWKITQI